MDNVHKQSKNKLLTEASSFSQNTHLKIILETTTKLKKKNKTKDLHMVETKYKKTHYELYLFPSLTKMPEINEDFN